MQNLQQLHVITPTLYMYPSGNYNQVSYFLLKTLALRPPPLPSSEFLTTFYWGGVDINFLEPCNFVAIHALLRTRLLIVQSYYIEKEDLFVEKQLLKTNFVTTKFSSEQTTRINGVLNNYS